ncbi:MAG: calcium-binding protein [Pseudomonadota bacterium]
MKYTSAATSLIDARNLQFLDPVRYEVLYDNYNKTPDQRDPLNYDPDARYSSAFLAKVFGDTIAPVSADFAGIYSMSVEGQFLDDLTPGIPDKELDLGPDVDLPGSDALAKHDAALQTLLVYADTTPGLNGADPDWKRAGKYFWPVMYREDFAGQIGMGGIAGRYSADQKMRVMIAYSALDEGARPFGDTGIRALYNDANDLGYVLNSSGQSQTLIHYAVNISKGFVQFAAQMAKEAVLREEHPDVPVTNGVLTRSEATNNHTLTLNFDDTLWGLGPGAAPEMVAQDTLFGNILDDTGEGSSILTEMGEHWGEGGIIWGDSASGIIEQVIFSTLGSGGGTTFLGNTAVAGEASVFVGSAGNDSIRAAKGNNLIYGAGGTDTVSYENLYASGTSVRLEKNADGSITVVKGVNGADGTDILAGIDAHNVILASLDINRYNGAPRYSIEEGSVVGAVRITGIGFYTRIERAIDYSGSGSISLIFSEFDPYTQRSSQKFSIYLDKTAIDAGTGLAGLILNDTLFDTKKLIYTMSAFAPGYEITLSTLSSTYAYYSANWSGGGGTDDVYNVAFGLNTVSDTSSGTDKIVFSADYNPADISYAVNGTGLDILFSGTPAVHIENQFTAAGQIETLQFSDNSTVGLATVQVGQNGTSGDDVITGFTYGASPDNLIYGLEGNDTISGGAGNDTIDGGTGNNVIDGGTGNDVYLINSGFDMITDSSGNDKITFGSGYNPGGMTFARVDGGTGLEISFGGAAAAHIDDFFSSGDTIETLQFSDSSTVDLTACRNINGTSGNDALTGLDNAYLPDDFIYGNDGDDTLDGGAGNDHVFGGAGNDTYVYGSGMDTVSDTGGNDKIVFASGFDEGDMTLVRSGATGLDILFSSTEAVHIDGQFTAAGQIETLQFSDSSTLDLSTATYTTVGTSGDDTIQGIDIGSVTEVIDGLGGNDTIYGYAGNDTIDGGDGNNILHAGAGDNTYLVNSGTGTDVISDAGGNDRITFGTAFNPADMTLERSGAADLNILFDNAVVATIQGQFTDAGKIETLAFHDNSTFDLSTVSYAVNGTSGDDTLYGISAGGNPDDVIYGYDGNRVIAR